MHPQYEAYLDDLHVLLKSRLTITRYRDVIRDLDRFTDNQPPAGLDRETLRRFAVAPCRGGRARSPAGVNVRLAALRSLFEYLVSCGAATQNPIAGVKGIRVPRATPSFMTSYETEELLAHLAARPGLNNKRDFALVVLGWQRGLRVSELARLNVRNFDAKARFLRRVRRKRDYVVDLELNSETVERVASYLESRGPIDGDAPLFAAQHGGHLTPRAIQALMQSLRRELGWTRPLHPHVLRRTFATDLLEDGNDIALVADLLDHADLRTVTAYAKVLNPARRKATEAHGKRLRSAQLHAVPTSDARTENVTPGLESPCAEQRLDEAA
ncbi:MAG: tyrosine-type recombinase/integrase [Polyangiaceae bacterium]